MSVVAAAPSHVYLHVPFCRARCDYCEFYSMAIGDAGAEPGRAGGERSASDRERLLDRYVAALLADWEMERREWGVRRVRTVFLGGGTPSLLGVPRLERLLSGFAPWLTPAAEVTLETNPEDVVDEFAGWAAQRALRVSLGVQSFVPHVRAALGRRGQADPEQAARRLRRAGCRSLSLDLIFGADGQCAADVDADLAGVAALRPEHVSWYQLSGAAAAPASDEHRDDLDATFYRHIVRRLGALGYRWYEVSNFAMPGSRCRHNSAVWRGQSYLGLGAGAVGTVGDVRRQVRADLHAYLDALAPVDGSPPQTPPRSVEHLDVAGLARERVYLAARRGVAIPLDSIRHVLDSAQLGTLSDGGFIRVRGGTLVVTRRGRFVADEVCLRLLRAPGPEGTT